ncbi:MAG: iron chelate uptake ABC transporter family permease subunit [Kiritimatiellae bacterium]|nr:iron chelate uptake ABC transporter family permease subunit [Kiritimatiellia bacterium]
MNRVLLILCLAPLLGTAQPEPRYASAAPNLTEMIYALGAEDHLVGRSTACDTPEAVLALPTIGPFAAPDAQSVLALHPTHLFATFLVDPALRPLLTEAGVTVVEIPCSRLGEIPDALETLGHWTGKADQARTLADHIRKGLRAFRSGRTQATGKTARRVLALLDPQQPFTAGRETLISDLLTGCGVQNLGDLYPQKADYFIADLAEIARLDPDLILCLFKTDGADPSALFSGKIGWEALRAVRSGRVYAVPHLDTLIRPGPRILNGLQELRNILDDDAARHRPAAAKPLDAILRELKWARTLTALLVGAALALAGCVLQTLLRNPLADPYILGVSGGASLGAAVWIALGLGAVCSFGIPLFAFAAAFASLWLVCAIARHAGNGMRPETLILAGVMVSAVESSLLLLIITFATPGELHSITWWMLGNLQGASWPLIGCCAGIIALAAGYLFAQANRLNALLLGEAMASTLGVDTRREIPLLLIAATLATAAAVSLAGVIGFVGLMIPHLVRRLVGANHRRLLPVSFVGGALFVWLCDLIATRWMPTGSVPVGVITALTGGPFFLFLLLRPNRRMPC